MTKFHKTGNIECCCCCKVASVVSDSVRPHWRQPTRLHYPWDSPGKNTGVGCHFLLQCMKMKSEREVTESCLTLRDPMDCSPPGSSVHGTFQARVLEWGAIAFSGVHWVDLSKGKNEVVYKGSRTRMASDFSLATHETGRQWNNVFAVLGENFFQYRFFAQPNYQSSVGVNKDIFRHVRYFKNFHFPRNFS